MNNTESIMEEPYDKSWMWWLMPQNECENSFDKSIINLDELKLHERTQEI